MTIVRPPWLRGFLGLCLWGFFFTAALPAQSADQLYQAGRQAYNQGMFGLAQSTLQQFLDTVSWDDSRADDAAYLAGVASLRQGDYAAGTEIFLSFAQRYPGSAYLQRSSYWLGVGFYGLGRYAEARTAFEEQLRHPSQETYYFRSLLYAANAARRIPDARAAEALLRRLLREAAAAEEDSSAAAAGYHLGDLLLAENRLREGREELKALIFRYPGNPYARKAHFLLGESFLAADQEEEALKRYQRILELYPRSDGAAEAAYRVVEISRRLGDRERALSALALLRERGEGGDLFPQAAEMAAGMLLEEGQWAESRRIWQELRDREKAWRPAERGKAFPLPPGSAAYHLGLSWEGEGRMDRALTLYREALSQLPPEENLLRSKALFHGAAAALKQEEIREAEAFWEELRRDHPHSRELARTVRLLAEGYRSRGSADRAETLFTRMLISEGDESLREEWFFRRGEVRLEQGHRARAQADFMKARGYSPEALYQVAYIYTLGREYRRAERLFAEAEKEMAAGGPLGSARIQGAELKELLARTRLARGLCSYNLEEYEKARRRFHSQVLQGKAGDPWRGEALYYRGRCEQKTDRLLPSVESFRLASQELDQPELRRDSLYQAGWSYLQMERYDSARRMLTQLSRASGASADERGAALILIGRSYMRQARWDEALESFEEVWPLNPGNEVLNQARLRIIQVLLRAGRDEEITRYAGEASWGTRQEWEDPRKEAYDRTAAEALSAGQPDRSAELYLHLLSTGDGVRMELRLKAAFALQRARRFEEGAEVILEGLQLSPADPLAAGAGLQLSQLIRQSRRGDWGKAWLNRLRALNPRPAVWVPAALAWGQLSAETVPAEVEALLDEIRTLSLPSALKQEALYLAAETARVRGNTKEALRLVKPLREGENASLAARARLLYGRLLADQGEDASAADEWSRIFLFYPDQEEAAEGLYRAVEAYRAAGDSAAAAAAAGTLRERYPESDWAAMAD